MGEADGRRMVWIDPVRREGERMRQVAETLQAGGDAPIAVEPHVLASLLLAVHHDQSYRRRSSLWEDAVALTDAVADALGSALPPLPTDSFAVHHVEPDDRSANCGSPEGPEDPEGA